MKQNPFNWRPFGSAAAALGLTGLLLTSSAWAQDEAEKADKAKQTEKAEKSDKVNRIRIVNRDGQELNPKIVIKKAGQDAIEAASDAIDITHDNGVFTVRDADGKERQINAVSVMVSSSQKTTVENGEEKTEIVKKAIVTDADGKTYEIDLSNGDPGAEATAPMVFRKASVGKYMIGVAAQPVSEALAEQLDLDANTGLVVEQISPQSPAEKAGLKVDDVLLFADQKPLNKVEDLVSAVQAAGEKKEALSLTLVREDKEMSLEITPEERNLSLTFNGDDGMRFEFQVDPDMKEALGEMSDFNFDWAEAGPGIVIKPGDLDPEAIRAQIEMMQQQHRAHMDQLKKAFADREQALGLGKIVKDRELLEKHKAALELQQEAASDAAQMRELMEEIKLLRQEIESLKKDKK